MASTGESPDPGLQESLAGFRNFELTEEAGERIRETVFGVISGATSVELPNNYDEQPLNNGTEEDADDTEVVDETYVNYENQDPDRDYPVFPLMEYEIARPDLMFTDIDRRHANLALKDGQADSALIERLKEQATTGKSHQAAFFLEALGIAISN